MADMLEQLRLQVVGVGPTLLAGLAVLVIGYLLALVIAFFVRKALGRTAVENRISHWMSGTDSKVSIPIARWVGKGVFYLIMLFVLIAFVQIIRLSALTDTLNAVLVPFVNYLPRLVGALALLLVAWVIATVVRNVARAGAKRVNLEEKLGAAASAEEAKSFPAAEAFPDILYWLVFLLFLPLILQTLNMQALLEPVTAMFNKIFAFLPNIISAGAVLLVGWFIARLVQRIAQSLLAGAGVDRLSEKCGLDTSLGKQKLSALLGLVVYFLILIPVLISALSALQLDAITRPATEMLGKILGVLPNLFGAAIVILIAVVVGKVLSGLVTNILAGIGFNNVLVKLGLAREPVVGKQSPASIVGLLVMIFVLLLGTATATDMLEFKSVGVLINDFIALSGRILMGVLIFGLGLLLAQVVARGISASDSANSRRLALLARVVILVLAGAMALKQTGVADSIVNLAFGLSLGGVAVAAALAFGLGGREFAARSLSEWRSATYGDGRHAPTTPRSSDLATGMKT
jgi:hypothetical protein